MRILVVEDEPDLALAVAAGLRRDGYAVDVAGGRAEALARTSLTPYDLVCLDLNLPDGDGLDVCRALTAEVERPKVLMLTARGSVEDRIVGLDGGADDYLVKPFSLAELAARVRALLRRDSPASGAVLRAGGLELDAATHTVRHLGVPVTLTAKEFALLRWFLLHPNVVHSAERLLEHVWDEHADPFTNTVRVTISNLRRKLADAAGGTQPIETLPGRGYRLVA
ncbi:MAG TPA: response regulator transcription factor [Acidimicrobiales bacterium]